MENGNKEKLFFQFKSKYIVINKDWKEPLTENLIVTQSKY